MGNAVILERALALVEWWATRIELSTDLTTDYLNSPGMLSEAHILIRPSVVVFILTTGIQNAFTLSTQIKHGKNNFPRTGERSIGGPHRTRAAHRSLKCDWAP